MKGLKIQINDEVPVTVAAENFSFVLLDTAMRPDRSAPRRQSENPNRGNLNPISHYKNRETGP